MASQRFCLRWNNHQSNLLTTFDQHFNDEQFTDVTLAIDGQYVKAHKIVLSACSPYFQSLFVNHPEKHPIVILKDVPFADMKSLLQFMYRGEVSVDQERLSAFLRVAESLRIKGLTEVNDDKPLSRDQSETPPSTQNRVHPYVLQQQQQQRKVLQQNATHSNQQLANNPLLGSALSMPKRKRGRPRKLSGSDDVDEYDDDYRENLLQNSSELLEVKMGTENEENSDDHDTTRQMEDNDEQNKSNSQTGSQNKRQSERSNKETKNTKKDETLNDDLLIPKTEPMEINEGDEPAKPFEHNQQLIHVSSFAKQTSDETNLASVINQLQQHQQNSEEIQNSNNPNNEKAESISLWLKQANSPQMNNMTSSLSVAVGQKSMRRRIRRKQTSPNDQAEALTEMSVRGLNLFRYASIQDGVYKCTECAKENVQKTFKNKYSFQRHAFLYHEGTQRKVFPCPVCRKEFSRPDKMKNHMKMTHDCYVPKECKYPLPLIAGTSQSAQSMPINNNVINISTPQ